MIAGGASYNYGVHSMVTMVDTFLVETLTQFNRNGGYGVTFGSGGGIADTLTIDVEFSAAQQLQVKHSHG